MNVDAQKFERLAGRKPVKQKTEIQILAEAVDRGIRAIQAIKTEAPKVDVSIEGIKVDVPEIKLPQISIPEIKVPASTFNLPKPTEWEFIIQRDQDGRLSKIIAKPL